VEPLNEQLEACPELKSADKPQSPEALMVLAKGTVWETFFKTYPSYQRSTRGGGPPTYVVRDESITAKFKNSIDNRMIDFLHLHGPNYDLDNRRVSVFFPILIN
jgi:hypothetical protein